MAGTIQSRLLLDTKNFSAGLKFALKEGRDFSSGLSGALGKGVALPKVSVGSFTAVNRELKEQNALAKAARDSVSNLRVAFERGELSQKEFLQQARELDRELVELRGSVDLMPPSLASFNRALGTSARGIDTAEGRLSKLGLSQQIAIGTANQFSQSLAASTGPIGSATLGLVAMGGGLGAVSAGTAVAGAGILGVGVATAALVQRGIPQVKSLQNSFNILAASGTKDLGQVKQDLRDLQDEIGKPAEAFSRAELAAAIADTTKAGTTYAEALDLVAEGTRLAAAENQNLTESTGLILQNLRQFGLGADEAGRAANVLAQGGLLAAGTARDLSLGLADVGPIARAAGLSLEETTALLIGLDNQGLSAATVGANGLRSILAALSKPSKEAEGALTRLGVSLKNADGTTKSVKDRLFEARDAIRSSGKELTEFSEIADTYALTALLALSNSTDDYTQKLIDAEGVAEKYALQLLQGLSPAQVAVNKAMDDLAGTAAEVFAPAIIAGAEAVATLVRNVDDFLGKAGSFESKLKIAFGSEEIKVLEGELAGVRTQIEGLETKGERLSKAPKFLGLSIFGSPEEIRAELAANEAVIKEYEAQAADLQARIDKVSQPQGKAKKKPKPEARNIVPEVSADYDKGVQEYINALTSAEDRAAQAQLSAMESGATRIQAQRALDLQQARRAFDESIQGLKEGSDKYNGFLAAYNQETTAINTRATTDLQREGEARVKAAQTLVSDIDKLKSDVAAADAEASGNIIAAITARSAQASKQLEQERQTMLARVEGDTEESRAQILSINTSYDDRERQLGEQLTRDLTTEAQRRADTLQSIAERTASIRAQTEAARQRDSEDDTGAVQTELNARLAEIQNGLDRELAAEGRTQAEITALHKQANAERVAVREDAARQTETIVKAEADAAEAVLEASAKSLQQAELAGVEGAIPQLRANFEAEQAERRANNAKTLEDFTGTSQDRFRLIQQQGQLETILTRQNQLQINRAAQEGQDAYLKALKEAQEEALAQSLANNRALLAAAKAVADQDIASKDPTIQTQGYEALVSVQQELLAQAQALTAAERARGASAAEVISALSAEAEAQRGVVDAVESQIGSLKKLRDEQQQVITNGSAVLEYARNAAAISGQRLDYNAAGDAIQAEERAQYDLLQAAIAANAPFEERAELLNQLVQTQKTLNDLGQKTGLSYNERQLVGEQGAAQLDAYPAQAAEALKQIKSLDDQIADLGGSLEEATTELRSLLEAAATDGEIALKVKAEVDKGALAQAEQALRNTFGAGAASRIISEAQSAGTRGGRGMVMAFRDGLLNNRPQLLSAVDSVLNDVRRRLPSSDAKTGPLSDLTYSGGKLVTTFGAGMLGKRSSLASTASLIAATAKPAFTAPTIPTSKALSYPAMAAGGAAGNTYIANVDGRSQQANAIFGGSLQTFMNGVERELRVRKL